MQKFILLVLLGMLLSPKTRQDLEDQGFCSICGSEKEDKNGQLICPNSEEDDHQGG
jgi:hypothetical protein